MDNLQDIRAEINETDKELYQLLEKRFRLSERVANVKMQTKEPVYAPLREKEIIDAIRFENLTFSDLIVPVSRDIMAFSRSLQYKMLYKTDKSFTLPNEIESGKVTDIKSTVTGFCGDNGSYSETAAKNLFPSSKLTAFTSFEDVCIKVSSGEVDFGVLPLENTTAGTVNDVYDYLVKYHLYIVKSENIPIEHCLSGVYGSSEDSIKTVCSHPQALAQCSDYIREKSYQIMEFSNTAFAAKYISEQGDKSLAAICSHTAAKENRLQILKQNINNESCNRTRFIALSKKLLVTETADRISIVFSLPHESGALSSILSVFSALNLNLLKIQSRPLRDRPWEYYFYLDFVVGDSLESAFQVLYQLSKELPFCKFLGYYCEKNSTFS